MKKTEDLIKTLREDLGAIRSCALMMAHAQSNDARTGYLKTLNQHVASMDSLLAQLPGHLPPSA